MPLLMRIEPFQASCSVAQVRAAEPGNLVAFPPNADALATELPLGYRSRRGLQKLRARREAPEGEPRPEAARVGRATRSCDVSGGAREPSCFSSRMQTLPSPL